MGVTQNVREQIIQLLFGANGLALSPDESVFEDRRASVLQYVRQYCPGAEDYIGLRVIPKLLNNCTTSWRAPWLGPQRWTNNACESANNIIKLALNWKPARLTDLVRHLHELVTAQYKSVDLAAATAARAVSPRSQLLRNSLLAARRTSLLNAGIPAPNYRHQRLARVAGLAVRLAVLAVLAVLARIF